MTPKENADELFYKMLKQSFSDENISALHRAKKCALIAVDEILNNFGTLTEGKQHYAACCTIKFYEQVKKEIELL